MKSLRRYITKKIHKAFFEHKHASQIYIKMPLSINRAIEIPSEKTHINQNFTLPLQI